MNRRTDLPGDCPMCAAPAADMHEACSGCPLARGCAVSCCPRCGYQFVERSATINLLLTLWGGARGRLSALGRAGLR
jgi:hypothetical protein